MSKKQLTHKSDRDGRFTELTHIDNPLPDIEEIKKWAEIIPNAPERILVMSEKEQAFRHKLIDFDHKRFYNHHRLGMILGTFIFTLGFTISGFLIYINKVLEGSVFAGGLVVVAGAMLINKKIFQGSKVQNKP